jgi:hypothetical protein
MGVLMILLAGALKQKSMVIYASIIILSTDITIAFAIHNFVFPAADNFNYFSSFFSLSILITVAFFVSQLYSKADRVDSDQVPDQATITDNPVQQEESRALSILGEETAAASDETTDQNRPEEMSICV